MANQITQVLGIVGFSNKGGYDTNINYEKNDIVTYNGSSYCAKTNTQGNAPTDSSYWSLMAQKGEKGDTGSTPEKGVDYFTQEDIDELESTLKDDVHDEVSLQVGSLSSAAPLAASSVSGMTDTTRIYVNTTDGYWYYYDGSNWQPGGVYQAQQSTDNVLSTIKTLKNIYSVENIEGSNFEFVNGIYNTQTGVFSTSSTRITNKDYLPSGIKTINIESGYNIFLLVFDSTDIYQGVYRTGTHTIEKTSSFNWASTKLEIPYDLISDTDKLRIVIRKSGNSSITPSASSVVNFTYELLDKFESGNEEEVVINTSNLEDYSAGTLFTFDEDFVHSNPISIYKVNNKYTTNFDVNTRKLTVSDSVYVSPNGDDNLGTGTEDNPYLTLEMALSKEANTIYLKPGTYYLGTNFSDGLVITKSINLISDNACLFFGDKSTNLLSESGIMRIRSNVYCEGITFNGGRGLIVETSNATPTFNKCKFINANQNGLNFRGLGCYVVDCEAAYNELDGFNYHAYNGVSPTGVIEINCKGHHNGNITNRSSNGSTIHENGRIIRLKGEYYLNHGGNIAESESMSYNFDLFAHDSTNYNVADRQYSANYNSLSNSGVWLYNCVNSGSVYKLSAVSGSYIYVDYNFDPSYTYTSGSSVIYFSN